MATITVDYEKCGKCGLCVKLCPVMALETDDAGHPRTKKRFGMFCTKCGHCLASCPKKALNFEGSDSKNIEELESLQENEHNINFEQMKKLIRTRRSIRQYADKPVAQEKIIKILDTLRWAPTGKNFQSVHWSVVNGKERVKELAGLSVEYFKTIDAAPMVIEAWDNNIDMVNRSAPCLVVAHANTKSLTPDFDCVIALTTLELLAKTEGLGTCWAGFFTMTAKHSDEIKKFLKLPEGHEVYGSLMLGYPSSKYSWIPPREELKVQFI